MSESQNQTPFGGRSRGLSLVSLSLVSLWSLSSLPASPLASSFWWTSFFIYCSFLQPFPFNLFSVAFPPKVVGGVVFSFFFVIFPSSGALSSSSSAIYGTAMDFWDGWKLSYITQAFSNAKETSATTTTAPAASTSSSYRSWTFTEQTLVWEACTSLCLPLLC